MVSAITEKLESFASNLNNAFNNPTAYLSNHSWLKEEFRELKKLGVLGCDTSAKSRQFQDALGRLAHSEEIPDVEIREQFDALYFNFVDLRLASLRIESQIQ